MLSASGRADTLLACESLEVITHLCRAHHKQEHPVLLLLCMVKWNWKFTMKDWCHIHIPLTFYSHFFYYTSVILFSFFMDFTVIMPWKPVIMASVLGVYRIPLHHNEEHKHKVLHIAFQNKESFGILLCQH